MLLEADELALFFKLHRSLMFFVNRRLKTLPDKVATPNEFSALPPKSIGKVRDALSADLDPIDAYVDENPDRFPEDELEIVRSWRHQTTGKFYIYRELKKYTVFLTASDPAIAYGVLALSTPFEDVIDRNLPVLADAVLLPFKGAIVYDGFLSFYNVSFGPGIRRSLNESFKQAKERHGIVTSLPMMSLPPPARVPKAASAPKRPSKEEKEESLTAVAAAIDRFCREHLNAEYAQVCRKLAEKLSRKRPSPMLQGNANAWAAAIVRAVGGVNFLHDKSNAPYLRATDVDRLMGAGAGAASAKLAVIRELFGMRQFDPDWTLPSRMDDNPLVWMLKVNGFMMDIRHAPRESQVVAFEKGLIPYIPADRR